MRISDWSSDVCSSDLCVAYNDYPENIVLRAVANYVARRFRVVASSRDRIVRGVLEAMFDQTPIHVIRRDLSSFYETIPLEPVRSRLRYDTHIPRSVRERKTVVEGISVAVRVNPGVLGIIQKK